MAYAGACLAYAGVLVLGTPAPAESGMAYTKGGTFYGTVELDTSQVIFFGVRR